MAREIVRVLRVIEYVGDREAVEDLVTKSIHGEKHISNYGKLLGQVTIRAATIGTYPEILENLEKDK
jgi:hypothetical protein